MQYGPSWRVPLHAKQLDMPWHAHKFNVRQKLDELASPDGVIYEDAVRALDRNIEYDELEMNLILAQLNILKEQISWKVHRKRLVEVYIDLHIFVVVKIVLTAISTAVIRKRRTAHTIL